MTRTVKGNSPKAPDPSVDLDPYFAWVLGAGRSNFFLAGRQGKWMPVLVKLTGGTTIQDFAEGSFFKDEERKEFLERWLASVKVLEIYTLGKAGEEKDAYCVAMVTDEFPDLLKNSPAGDVVASVELGRPLDAESLGAEFPL